MTLTDIVFPLPAAPPRPYLRGFEPGSPKIRSHRITIRCQSCSWSKEVWARPARALPGPDGCWAIFPVYDGKHIREWGCPNCNGDDVRPDCSTIH